MLKTKNCYLAGITNELFQELDNNSAGILDTFDKGTNSYYVSPTDKQQKKAWKDELKSLKSIRECIPNNWGIVFEYVLNREGGRRPDVILLTGSRLVFILEFKQYASISDVEIDQLAGYRRDLYLYNPYMRDKEIKALLVETETRDVAEPVPEHDKMTIVSVDKLGQGFTYYKNQNPNGCSQAELDAFLNSPYKPLPELVNAIRESFENNKLPEFSTSKSLNVPVCIDKIMQIKHETVCRYSRRHSLILVTGVPGAGKTMAGISLIIKSINNGMQDAVMLSGNNNLVEIVDFIVKNRIDKDKLYRNNPMMARDGVHTKLMEKLYDYLVTDRDHMENMIVLDEAQRLWDNSRTSNRTVNKQSEPEQLLQIGNGKDWFVIVALIGEGQQIGAGEEGGIKIWEDAFRKYGYDWQIYCPQEMKQTFLEFDPVIEQSLSLDVSLRSQAASKFPEWVDAVLNNNWKLAHNMVKNNHLFEEFPVYVSRSYETCEEYLVTRFKDTEKTYGLVTSSNWHKHEIMPSITRVPESYSDFTCQIGPWFCDPPDSEKSCRNMRSYITEFKCQGLEIDMPCLIWGPDFRYSKGNWSISGGKRDKTFLNPLQIRKNCYRVLMTRGREGLLIYIPERFSELNETYDYLKLCGCLELNPQYHRLDPIIF